MTGGTWRLTTSLNVDGTRQPTGALAATTLSNPLSASQSLPYGTGAGAMTIAVQQKRTLLPGTSETFDLFTGTDLVDVFGDAAAFRVLRAWAIWVDSGGDAAGVTINGGASNPLNLTFTGTTPGETVYPLGPAAAGGSRAGVAVTSTAKNVRVTNNGTVPVTYVIALAGSQSSSGLAAGPPGIVYP